MKRQRGRNRNKSNNNSNRSLDSNGPDVKVRGNASTIYEKYTTLARDAAAGGNRVKAENYRQHAEHYLRLVNIQEAAKQAARDEAEAAKAARGESDNDDGDAGEGKENSRRNRRYPPRVKRSRDNDAQEAETTASEPEGLEVVSTQASGDDVASESEAPETKRRRKAPKRKDEAEPEAEVDAAE